MSPHLFYSRIIASLGVLFIALFVLGVSISPVTSQNTPYLSGLTEVAGAPPTLKYFAKFENVTGNEYRLMIRASEQINAAPTRIGGFDMRIIGLAAGVTGITYDLCTGVVGLCQIPSYSSTNDTLGDVNATQRIIFATIDKDLNGTGASGTAVDTQWITLGRFTFASAINPLTITNLNLATSCIAYIDLADGFKEKCVPLQAEGAIGTPTLTPPPGATATLTPPPGATATLTPPPAATATLTPPPGATATLTPPPGSTATPTPTRQPTRPPQNCDDDDDVRVNDDEEDEDGDGEAADDDDGDGDADDADDDDGGDGEEDEECQTHPRGASAKGLVRDASDVAGGQLKGLAGTTIRVSKCEDPQTAVKTRYTKSNGKYLVKGLPPGCYDVRFTLPQAYVFCVQALSAVSDPARDVVEHGDRTTVRLTTFQELGDINVCATRSRNLIDLKVDTTVTDAKPRLNDSISLTITVKNESTNPATGVKVRHRLPAGLQYKSHDITGDGVKIFDQATGLWDIGELKAGATRELKINAQVTQVKNITTITEINAANEPDIDSIPHNNNDKEDDYSALSIMSQPSATGGDVNAGHTLSGKLASSSSILYASLALGMLLLVGVILGPL